MILIIFCCFAAQIAQMFYRFGKHFIDLTILYSAIAVTVRSEASPLARPYKLLCSALKNEKYDPSPAEKAPCGPTGPNQDPEEFFRPKKTPLIPYQASLELLNKMDADPICGGAIVSNDSILTAASCFMNVDLETAMRRKDYLIVRVGSGEAGSGGSVHEVTEVIIPKDYQDGNDMNYDIAIVKVLRTFPFGKNIMAIELNNKSLNAADRNVNASSYGLLRQPKYCRKENSVKKHHLQKLVSRTYKTDQCKAIMKQLQMKYTEPKLCLIHQDPNESEKKFFGDKGSPLVHENKLIGLLSWESPCFKERIPAVYTDIGHNYKWLMDHPEKPITEKLIAEIPTQAPNQNNTENQTNNSTR